MRSPQYYPWKFLTSKDILIVRPWLGLSAETIKRFVRAGIDDARGGRNGGDLARCVQNSAGKRSEK